MRIAIQRRCFTLLLVLSLSYAGLLWAQTEEKLLEEINQLSDAERQARLVSGAKKEGAVTWYVAMNRAYAQDLRSAVSVLESQRLDGQWWFIVKQSSHRVPGARVLVRCLQYPQHDD